jgi:hypothetical protein
MPVTGNHKGKIEPRRGWSKGIHAKMVRLSEVKTQYPWCFVPNVRKALSDKEILTQNVEEESAVWRISLLPCLPGFAYVGFKVNTLDHDTPQIVSARTSQGADDKPLFGLSDDEIPVKKYPSGYIPFNFPIVSRLCHLNEDEIHLVLTFNTAVCGRVELIAQKFDELPEDDFKAKYYYTLNEEGGLLLQTEQYISFRKWDRISLINFYPSAIRLYRLDLDQNAL